VLTRARDLEPTWRAALGGPQRALARLSADHQLLALHAAMLPHHSDWQAGDAPLLAEARRKLALQADAKLLTTGEVNALLFDPPFLEDLLAGQALPAPAQA
jgi:hypothetical protein